MHDTTRKAIEDLEQAGVNAREKIKKATRALRSCKPTPVVNGVERPQTITFTKKPGESDAEK